MNLKFNKKRTIISVVFLIITLIFLVLNRNLFLVENTFHTVYFIVSILTTFLLCALFSIKIEFNEHINKIFTAFCIVFSIFYLIYIIELLNSNNMFSMNFSCLMFNFILISIVYLLIFCISNKLKFSMIFSNVILFLVGFANYVVSSIRGTPLSILDVLGLNTGFELVTTYTLQVNYYLILAIISFLFLIVVNSKLNYKFQVSKKDIIIRLLCLILTILVIVLLFFTDLIKVFNLHTDLWLPSEEYKHNGFLASSFKQSQELIIEEPENYSLSSIESIYLSVENTVSTSTTDDKTEENTSQKDLPNIIVIMNESFADMNVHRTIETSEDCLSYFKELSKNTISGNIHSSVIGGRTPNSEWEFLTNNTMSMFSYGTVPYQQFISQPSYSLVNTLEAQGYTSYAIHTWLKAGYRRSSVYPLLGFDYSFFGEDLKDELDFIRNYPSDLSTYKQIIKLYEEKDENENFFNFTLTMQNHSGYDYEGSDFESTVSITNIDDCPRAEQYMTLLKESDEALEYLINYFSNVEEDTIILFFGDHQPPYLDSSFWEYLNEGKDMNSLEDIEKDYITPFFLWTNFETEKIDVPDISLNYLSILLLDIAGLETTPYMEYLRELQKEIPVITGHGYMDKNGTYHTLDEENEYKSLINEYHILQYNNMFDRKNSVSKMFEIH